MLRFAVDENFNMHIVNGVLRWFPGVDIVRVQDAGLKGRNDPIILEWAAREERILLTHDVNTMPALHMNALHEGCQCRGDLQLL